MNVHPTLRYPQQRKVKLQRWPEQRAGGKKNSQDKHVYEYVLQIRVFFYVSERDLTSSGYQLIKTGLIPESGIKKVAWVQYL